eukprot:Hpha_TRINITY_DN16680_c2_g14::TRINITY_DN16680_c2_g14_i1::g.182401::m.182401/K10408/DNAH; dynein heavy chain, axonemal
MAAAPQDVARRYLLSRVADLVTTPTTTLDVPLDRIQKETLSNFEADIAGDSNASALITSFLSGHEIVEKDGVKTPHAGVPVLLFYFEAPPESKDAKAKGDPPRPKLKVTTQGHFIKSRGAYAIRATQPDPKKGGVPKPVSAKEVDMVQEIHCGPLEADNKEGGKRKLMFLDAHKQILDTVYRPVFTRLAKWGQCSAQQRELFHSSIADYCERLEDFSKQESHVESVRLPQETFMKTLPSQGGGSYQKAASDPKLVKHFEECVESWCGIVERLVADKPADADQEPQNIDEEVGPLSELSWWKERAARFACLDQQLQVPEVKTVHGVLTAAKSPVLKQWAAMDQQIAEASNEAKENVRYLSSLQSFFEALEKETPQVIIELLPALVNNIKMMYTIARYYATDSHMMVLFCKITNQLIKACKADIRQGGGISAARLWAQTQQPDSLKLLIARLQNCMELNKTYRGEFNKASDRLKMRQGGPQFSELNELHIFGKFELFCKRVHKLIDVFETIEQFQSLSEYNIDGMGSLIDRFFEHVDDLKKKAQNDPLDQSTPQFDRAFNEWTKNIAELESSLQVFINSSFENITSTENALALLSKFKLILNRKSLRSDLESKYMVIFHNYGLDLENVQKTYDRQKHQPPMVRNITHVAGSIIWGRQLLRRIETPMQNFKENKTIMSQQKESKKIIRTYNKIARALIEFETVWYNAWVQSIEGMKSGLSATLLVRHNQKLFVNFDIEILQLVKESRHIMRMGIHIPQSAKMVLMQEHKFKTFHDQLSFAIKEYDRVVSRIIPVTKSLMARNLEMLDTIIRPGESSLTWTSMNIDGYIQRVHSALSRLDVVVSQVNNIVHNRIQSNLKFISSTLLVNLPENQSFSLEQFVSLQEKHIKGQSELMDIKNCEVEKAAEDVILTIIAGQKGASGRALDRSEYEHEATTLKAHFNNLMFKAILTTTTRSLNLIKKRVGTRGNRTDFMQVDKPFFDVNVELSPPHVLLHPSLEEVQKAINQSATAVLKCSKFISPWNGVGDGGETFFEKIAKNKEIVKVVLLLTGGIHGLKKQVMDYLNSFKRYEYLWNLDKQVEYERFMEQSPTLDMFQAELRKYKGIEDDIDGIQLTYIIGSLSLDTTKLRQALKREAQEWKAQYARNLHQQAKQDLDQIRTQMSENDKALANAIQENDTLEDLRIMMDVLSQIRERESRVDHMFEPVKEMYQLLQANEVAISKEEEDDVTDLWDDWRKLRKKAQIRNDEIALLQHGFKTRLTREVDKFQKDVVTFREDFDADGPMVEGITPQDAMERLNKYKRIFEDKKASWTTFEAGEKLFGMPIHDYPQLAKTEKELGLLDKLYSLYVKVIQKIKGYSDILWCDLKQGGGAGFASLVEEVNRFQVQATKLPKALKTWDAYLELKLTIESFLGLEELISGLAHPAMRERHWREIMKCSGTSWKLDDDAFRLADILDAKLINFLEEVQDQIMCAQKEADIEKKYREIERNWKDTELSFGEFKSRGNLILKGDETNLIKEALEESQLQVGSMLASRFVQPFRGEVSEWMNKLSVVTERISLWQEVQAAWVWLEAVFAGGDIMKQLPAEAKRFAQIDKSWVKIMAKAGEQSNVILFCYDNELLDLLPNLKEQLDLCQKQLQSYLETKRRAFPRFYFVSEQVLLEVLSQASDPTAVQSNIESLFDGVSGVAFEKFKPPKGESGRDITKITMMTSHEGETIQLTEPVPCQGNVECWLLALVEQMQLTLRNMCSRVATEIPPMQQSVHHFHHVFGQYIAQVSLLSIQLLWTADVQEFLVG